MSKKKTNSAFALPFFKLDARCIHGVVDRGRPVLFKKFTCLGTKSFTMVEWHGVEDWVLFFTLSSLSGHQEKLSWLLSYDFLLIGPPYNMRRIYTLLTVVVCKS